MPDRFKRIQKTISISVLFTERYAENVTICAILKLCHFTIFLDFPLDLKAMETWGILFCSDLDRKRLIVGSLDDGFSWHKFPTLNEGIIKF